jgi:hypothetical protein
MGMPRFEFHLESSLGVNLKEQAICEAAVAYADYLLKDEAVHVSNDQRLPMLLCEFEKLIGRKLGIKLTVFNSKTFGWMIGYEVLN